MPPPPLLLATPPSARADLLSCLLKESGGLADLKMVAEDGQEVAHKLLLASCSPLLHPLLQTPDSLLLLPGWSLEAVSCLLQLLYTGRSQVQGQEVIQEVQELRQALGLEVVFQGVKDEKVKVEEIKPEDYDYNFGYSEPEVSIKEEHVKIEDTVKLNWKVKDVTIKLKPIRISIDESEKVSTNPEIVLLDSSSEDDVIGDSDIESTTPDETVSKTVENKIVAKPSNAPTKKSETKKPIKRLIKKTVQRQMFITKSIMTGIRMLQKTKNKKVACSECPSLLSAQALIPHYRKHALAPKPNLAPSSKPVPSPPPPSAPHSSAPSLQVAPPALIFTPPPSQGSNSAPSPPPLTPAPAPTTPPPDSMTPPTTPTTPPPAPESSDTASNFADFLKKKISCSRPPPTFIPPLLPPSASSRSSSRASLSSLSSSETGTEEPVLGRPAKSFNNTSSTAFTDLGNLEVDLEDYEKLLRAKFYKIIKVKKSRIAGRSKDSAVIVTEQEIDEEILKKPKDRQEEYKRLKFQQVWRKLYDQEYIKLGNRKLGKKTSRDQVKISDELVVAEILREQKLRLSKK